jgi:hypothetical protein
MTLVSFLSVVVSIWDADMLLMSDIAFYYCYDCVLFNYKIQKCE